MTEIVNLDDLVPSDIEFDYKGKKYIVDGDTSVENVFRLFSLYEELAEAQSIGENGESDEDQTVAVQAAFVRVSEHVLRLIQVRQPDVKDNPFGMKALMIVIQRVLAQLGLGVIEAPKDDEEIPTPPPARKPGDGSRASNPKRSPASTRPKTSTAARKRK